MSAVYPDSHVACNICPALLGELCFDRSAGGPEALPEIRRDVPHSGRKLSAKVDPQPRRITPQKSGTGTATPARRRAARSASTAASWAAVAERQQRRRDGTN